MPNGLFLRIGRLVVSARTFRRSSSSRMFQEEKPYCWAENTGITIDKLSLSRKIHTPIHRAAMDRKARDLTVRNAFEISRPKLVNGANVLLIDDVFTSGATASQCAKVLKKAGAKKVSVLTLARAV